MGVGMAMAKDRDRTTHDEKAASRSSSASVVRRAVHRRGAGTLDSSDDDRKSPPHCAGHRPRSIDHWVISEASGHA